MYSKSEPLTDAEFETFEADRDLAVDLLTAIDEMKAGKGHVIWPSALAVRQETGLAQLSPGLSPFFLVFSSRQLTTLLVRNIIGCESCNRRQAMSTTFGVKLDAETQQRLKAVASSLDRAPHWVMKAALADYLERQETFLREKEEDDRRWQRFQESGQGIEQERVMQWLDALAAGRKDSCTE